MTRSNLTRANCFAFCFMMDGFNPLDLLASAAELQQKHGDGPERIIVTRQWKSNGSKISTNSSGLKENRELSNNSISKNKPSVVIVKKIKKNDINPEVEKMLDEHNYGNAKRNLNKTDKGSDHVHEINEVKRKDTLLDDCCGSKQCEQTSTTEEQSIDKGTSVASNTTSQPIDSECNNLVKCTDRNLCFNRICSCKQENAEIKYQEYDGGADVSVEGTGLVLNKSIQYISNGNILSRTPDKPIMKYDSKQYGHCKVSFGNTCTDLLTYTEDGLELDEQTGKFKTKFGLKGIDKDSRNEKGENQGNCSDGEGTELGSAKQVEVETVSTHVAKKSLSVQKSLSSVKVGLSDIEINITGGPNSGDKITQLTASSGHNLIDCCEEGKSSDLGQIKSLLTENKLGERTDDNSGNKKKPVLLSIRPSNSELQHCNPTDLYKKSASCDSLKDLDITDSLCTDDSITSVHLLSPDCRNPDSMGIVQSPVTHNMNEEQHVLLGGADEMETQTGINFQAVKRNMFSASPLNSNSNRDHDSLSVETVSDCRKMTVEPVSLLTEKVDNCDNSANNTLPDSISRNDIPVVRFNSDHCYAGMPGKMDIASDFVGNEDTVQSEGEEAETPLGSASELSQDSGYEDVTQSPEEQQPTASSLAETVIEKTSSVKNLVPVLVSVNSNGCLTVHDTNLTKNLGGQVFLPENVKLITGTSSTSVSQAPLILSPVTVGRTACPSLTEAPKLVKSKPESIIEILSQKKVEMSAVLDSQEVSPPKYGKFRIGTFASFSNTSGDLELPTKLNLPVPVKLQIEDKSNNISQGLDRSQSNNGKSGKSSPVVDTLGTLVQKVKSSLSPASYVELKSVDHIQHDHDYCTKNLMPSVVNSFLEARLLSKDTAKGKITHIKGKKSESDNKHESKSSKRKRHLTAVTKDDMNEDYDVDSESDTLSIPDSLRSKYRNEPKHTDPKVKITGSSDFQDQFVYFMNTKKRSRRRESKDMPLPSGTDRVFIPPKPGDIVVPHLTDQDIENLKIRSKQFKHPPGTSCSNSLRTEFMAAKLGNGVFPNSQLTENVDDEKNIINTILSLENEDLVPSVQTEPPPYNESMELYGQGLNADIMNLLPEQMNLTPEQMDILYSAVDEVQNSSPGLVGAEKLVSAETSNSAFQFPLETFEVSGVASTTTITDCVSEAEDNLAKDSQPKQDTCRDEANITLTEASTAENDGQVVADITKRPEKSYSSECRSTHKQSKENTKKCVKLEEVTTEDDKHAKMLERKKHSGAQDTHNILSTFSEIPAIATQNITNDSSVSDESKKADNPVVVTAGVIVEKTSFPSPNLDSGSVATTLVSDISLQQIDKSLDLLGNDFRLDKSELFPVGTVPSTVAQPSALVDYNAPWIVTVSMYWNDLPAIMIHNQPFVRLVDIHKQILPAKDTGILKKRCQLMGIVVENCSEMQRYFLVQYGRAFNSKSTLIISKDNAKILIGYYVDPQPKTTRPEDHHKSIIDHRREQLRRIAFARRAAVRAQRLGEKKDEVDPRKIKEPHSELGTDQSSLGSMQEQLKKIEDPKVTSSLQHTELDLTHDGRPQRATRHKKINFLELLRGDISSHTGEEDSVNEQLTKNKGHHTVAEEKKKNTLKERKVKVVKYTIETDSSEETDSVMSDDSLENDDTDSSGSEIQVWKKSVKQKVCPSFATKVKSRIKGIPKSYNKRSLKVKFGLKRSKSSAASAPVAIQVVSKPTAVPKLVTSAYRSKLTQKPRKKLSSKKSPVTLDRKNILLMKSLESGKVDHNDEIENNPREVNDLEKNASALLNVQSKDKMKPEQNLKSLSADTREMESKISSTLPKQRSETVELPSSKAGLRQLKLVESVNVQTDSCDFENDDDTNFDTCYLNNTSSENNPESNCLTVIESGTEGNFSKFDLIGINSKSLSSTSVENSVMKRKSSVHIRNDETPIRIIHQDSNPQSQHRTRSQLGEVFVDHYHNKKSLCVRCYTCRKMMSVDNFIHHLHDVSGGLLPVILPRTIDLSEADLNESEGKLWETFLRKKELFDNNQLPSPDIVGDTMICNVSKDCTYSCEDNRNISQPGPRIITTPVSPMKREKVVRQNKTTGTNNLRLIPSQTLSHVTVTARDATEGVRTSSRKRKVKHLYGFEDYSFTKFPRLMKNAVVEDKDNQIT